MDIGIIRDHQGVFLDHQRPQKSSKNFKNQKNHQFQFLKLRFEALDERNRLVIFPKVENMKNYAQKGLKITPPAPRGGPGAAAPGGL